MNDTCARDNMMEFSTLKASMRGRWLSECSKVRFDALSGLSCTVDVIAVVLSTNAIVRAVHCDLHSCLVGIMLRGASALREC